VLKWLPWWRMLAIGLLTVALLLTLVVGKVGLHWARSSGSGGGVLYSRYEATASPLVTAVAVALELSAIALLLRGRRSS